MTPLVQHNHLNGFLDSLAALFTIGSIAIPFMYRWVSRIGASYTFSRDLATNHIPHMNHALNLIAKRLDVDLPEPPPIYFPVNGNGKHNENSNGDDRG